MTEIISTTPSNLPAASQLLRRAAPALLALSAVALVACGGSTRNIHVDGSSTVFPITQAVAEEFGKEKPDVRISVGVSGTGGGFKKFCSGKTDISNASRRISASEKEACAAAGIEYIELVIAKDGLSMVVHPENDWLQQLTVEQLQRIYAADPETQINQWSQLDPAFPEKSIKIFAPGADSGTYDYFVEAIFHEEGSMRTDVSLSENDNVLVYGIAGEKHSIGFFGYAYYEENKDKLRVVPVVNPGTGNAVAPSVESIRAGTYEPLSRSVYIYVKRAALERSDVQDFVRFYIGNAGKYSRKVGYVPLPDEKYQQDLKILAEAIPAAEEQPTDE